MESKTCYNLTKLKIKQKIVEKTNIKGNEEYEEISEKKTSKLGYILLILLGIFLFVIGQNVFRDIQSIPERPIPPNPIVESYFNTENLRNLLDSSNYYIYEKSRIAENQPLPPESTGQEKNLFTIRTPEFTAIDKKFKIDEQFKEIEPVLNSILLINKGAKKTEEEISSKEIQLKNTLEKYGVSLQEIIAKEESLMDNPGIRTQIVLLNGEISLLNSKLSEGLLERDEKIGSIKIRLSDIKTSYKNALEYYKDELAKYNSIAFLLKLLFVLPFFGASLYFYFKLHKRNSPNTIIMASILAASSALFMEIVIIFLYQILPTEWLQRIFKILKEFAALKYIIYYASAILVIVIFGGIVYLIQKKVFNPKLIAIRRLKERKCPNCSFLINQTYAFCPKCGKELKEKCQNCGNQRIKDLPFCQFCGKK